MSIVNWDTESRWQAVVVPPRRKALVVDHDRFQLEILSYRLEEQGFAVEAISSGERVWELTERLKPSLVIMDVELPDVDGLTVCQQIFEDPATCLTPVVLVSGTGRQDIVTAARRAGSRFFLRKPYDPNTLELIIQAVLNSDPW